MYHIQDFQNVAEPRGKKEIFNYAHSSLRNVIEETLTHAYFALKDQDYYDLLESQDHRIPALKQMIISLRTEKLLTDQLEEQIFKLYKFLSKAVHSEITKLNTGRTTTDKETFIEWYEAFIKVAIINFEVIIRMIEIGI